MNECVEASARLRRAWGGDDPFRWVERLDGEIYRAEGSRRVLRFQLDGEGFFARVERGVGWREIGKNLLALRAPVVDARNEVSAVRRLRACGVPCYEIEGWGVRGRSPAKRRSFVISREIAPAVSLEELAVSRLSNIHRRGLIEAVARLVARLHAGGVNHRDLYLCHLLLWMVPGEGLCPGEPSRLTLIDLHRAQVRAGVPRRWRVKDLAALWFSAETAGLTRRERLRFVRAYHRRLGGSLRAALGRDALLWRAVGRRAGVFAVRERRRA